MGHLASEEPKDLITPGRAGHNPAGEGTERSFFSPDRT